MIVLPSRALFAALVLVACAREEAPVAPPPLPQAPVAVAVPEPEAPQEPKAKPSAPPATREPKAEPKPTKSKGEIAERPKGWGAAYVPPPAPAPVAPAPVAPKPVATAPAPAPVAAKPKTRVSIPRTAHVHVEIPSGLQADLDADPRMQPWVEKVVSIADGCHAQGRSNVGAIEAVITMHENDRPNADVRSLPPQLGGLVACATGALMRTKMPLFTGREGTRYTVRVVFE